MDQASIRGLSSIVERVQGRYQRTVSRALFRRPLRLDLKAPIISFTFDDFPVSALRVGGAILRDHGARGTYYVSLGLKDSIAPTGRMFSDEDLCDALAQGHELGCHTFDHANSWTTTPGDFMKSQRRNAETIAQLQPGATFKTFGYPITEPHPLNKRAAALRFDACRGGGQTNNVGFADLALLRSFFLEKTNGDLEPVRRLIDRNLADRGWLIFSTHDVCGLPTPYGCTPQFFERVVACAVGSGATILPVATALEFVHKAA